MYVFSVSVGLACVFAYPSFKEVPRVVDSTDSTRPPTARTVVADIRIDLTEEQNL